MVSRYEQFTAVISSIYHYFHKIERNEMERYGLRGSYAQYLLAIDRSPEGITSAQLCEECDRDKAAVSRAIVEMEKCGLVIREINGERNYRTKVSLTDEGKRAAEYVRMRSGTAVELAGRGVSDANRVAMYTALEQIIENLHAISCDGMPADGTDYLTDTTTIKRSQEK